MLRQSVGELLKSHVVLELEGIDRLYLNGYVPRLQTGANLAYFIKTELGAKVASTFMLAPVGRNFVSSIEQFAQREAVDLVRFLRGQRKDELARRYRDGFQGEEGVLFIGKAQEKTAVLRTTKRTDSDGYKYPWITRSSAMVNHYYFYILDADFGPLFIKFSSYFPFAIKVSLNGNEWLKRQLTKKGIQFEALDNGILSCADQAQVQKIASSLDQRKIEAVFRKWLARLPHPFTPKQRAAGYRYELSILQSEFALTQVLDAPRHGRRFFEEVIRENMDLGRPDKVQMIFDRRIIKTTPGTFRTRVITQGVVPTLHIDYKSSRIKQYHKEGRALRTETTINNTYDFGIGRLLKNLPALCLLGFSANRRLLHVQQLSQDCLIGEQRFQQVTQPVTVGKQKASGLLFSDPRVQALLQALCLFVHSSQGFRHRDMRGPTAQLLGLDQDTYGAGQMTYDLRRLRLHGLIRRIPSTHRYTITDEGLRTAFFFTRLYARALCPALTSQPQKHNANTAAGRLEKALLQTLQEVHLAA